jgi:hypothetical protein
MKHPPNFGLRGRFWIADFGLEFFVPLRALLPSFDMGNLAEVVKHAATLALNPKPKTRNPKLRLSRRPAHPAPAEEMVMQVQDTLTGISARVDHDAETALGDPLRARELCRDLKDLADQRAVGFGDVQDADQMLARYDQYMHRRLGRDIFERDDGIILINPIGLNFALDDAAE